MTSQHVIIIIIVIIITVVVKFLERPKQLKLLQGPLYCREEHDGQVKEMPENKYVFSLFQWLTFVLHP